MDFSKAKDRANITNSVTLLKTIHGIGTISADGVVFAEASYFIEVSRDSTGLMRSDGMVDARLSALERMCQSEEPVLTLETGEQVRIIVTRIETGHALIRILGPVPGLTQYDGANSRDHFGHS